MREADARRHGARADLPHGDGREPSGAHVAVVAVQHDGALDRSALVVRAVDGDGEHVERPVPEQVEVARADERVGGRCCAVLSREQRGQPVEGVAHGGPRVHVPPPGIREPAPARDPLRLRRQVRLQRDPAREERRRRVLLRAQRALDASAAGPRGERRAVRGGSGPAGRERQRHVERDPGGARLDAAHPAAQAQRTAQPLGGEPRQEAREARDHPRRHDRAAAVAHGVRGETARDEARAHGLLAADVHVVGARLEGGGRDPVAEREGRRGAVHHHVCPAAEARERVVVHEVDGHGLDPAAHLLGELAERGLATAAEPERLGGRGAEGEHRGTPDGAGRADHRDHAITAPPVTFVRIDSTRGACSTDRQS